MLLQAKYPEAVECDGLWFDCSRSKVLASEDLHRNIILTAHTSKGGDHSAIFATVDRLRPFYTWRHACMGL